MRWTWFATATAVVAAIALGGGVRADDAARLVGKVSKPEKDGTFELSGPKGGPFQVVVNEETLVAVHKVTTLDQIPANTPLHVLAVHQAEEHDPKTGAPIPECVTQVLTIIAGEGFDPPERAKDGADKHEWLGGALMKDAHGFGLDRVQMNVGKDHVVILLEKGDKTAIAKGKPVVVEGAHTGEVKAKQFTATRVHVLAAQGSAGDYHNAFGL